MFANIFNQCCGSGMFIPDPGSDFFPSRIPDPNCLHPGSRILKEFKYFNPQKSTRKWFLSSKKYDPGCSSRIPDPDADFLPSRIPDPGVKKVPNPGSRIRIRNTVFNHRQQYTLSRRWNWNLAFAGSLLVISEVTSPEHVTSLRELWRRDYPRQPPSRWLHRRW